MSGRQSVRPHRAISLAKWNSASPYLSFCLLTWSNSTPTQRISMKFNIW
jgi:hypothetical protein